MNVQYEITPYDVIEANVGPQPLCKMLKQFNRI